MVLSYLNRLRHSKGYGIHSPFAFRFVNEVLCQHLPYYGYTAVGNDATARLALRLAAYFDVAQYSVVASPPVCKIIEKAITAAKSTSTPEPFGPSELNIIDLGSITTQQGARMIDALLQTPAHALLLNTPHTLFRALTDALPYGMTFNNGHGTLVLAALPHLPRQDFDVKF